MNLTALGSVKKHTNAMYYLLVKEDNEKAFFFTNKNYSHRESEC